VLALLTKHDVVNFKDTVPMGKRPGGAGGGIAIKGRGFKRAFPEAALISQAATADEYSILLVEPHWFNDYPSDGEEGFDKKIEEYAAIKAMKVLWFSDFYIADWTGKKRADILNSTQAIAGDSVHSAQMLKQLADSDNVYVLTEPVDVDEILPPTTPKPYIYTCGQASVEKGIADLIEVFERLKDGPLKTVYVGSMDTWGIAVRKNVHVDRLYTELSETVDYLVPAADRAKVKQIATDAWGYINAARYETFSFACAEAMSAATFCFCGDHPTFDGRPLNRFSTPADAADQIIEAYEKHGLTTNPEVREFVIDNYSLAVFRRQLQELAMKEMGFGVDVDDSLIS
jgi:glycosyltransferase involved in cell wall biosynthesis